MVFKISSLSSNSFPITRFDKTIIAKPIYFVKGLIVLIELIIFIVVVVVVRNDGAVYEGGLVVL